MSTAIIDARGWQNCFDLKRGARVEADTPAACMLKKTLKNHPYPGDLSSGGNQWVSDTAFELIERYNPRFVFLTYAAQYFSSRFNPMSEKDRSEIIAGAFREVERFVETSGFTAVIIGTGDMIPLIGRIDITRLDGLAFCTNWSTKYAGLYEPSSADMKSLQSNPLVEKIIPREDIVSLFKGTPEQAERVPEFLLMAREGYAFKGVSPATRIPVMIPSDNYSIPLSIPGSAVADITGIRGAVETLVDEKNVALIILEGVGMKTFLLPYTPCKNGKEWFCYETGNAQYLTISSGEHRFFDYPKGYKCFDEMDSIPDYPFSGYFKSIPQNTFAASFPGRSIAVGNKSMFMHMVTGTDISIECFSRNTSNQGTMGVIHRENKL